MVDEEGEYTLDKQTMREGSERTTITGREGVSPWFGSFVVHLGFVTNRATKCGVGLHPPLDLLLLLVRLLLQLSEQLLRHATLDARDVHLPPVGRTFF